MAETRKFYSKRVLLDYNIFLSDIDTGCLLLCLDNAQAGIIQTLLSGYGERRTNWVKQYVNDLEYEIPTFDEMAEVSNSISDIYGGLSMSCDFET